MTTPANNPAARPHLWVVCYALGEPSEPWLTRQISALRRFQITVLCWKRPASTPPGVAVHVLPFPADLHDHPHRWLHRLTQLPTQNFYAAPAPEALALSRLADRHSPNLVLCHYGHLALRLLPLAQRRGIPIVAHLHGIDCPPRYSNRWYSWSLARSIRRFTRVVVVGSHQKNWVLDHHADSTRVHLVPCGAPADLFRPAPRPDNPAPRFLAVSRLHEDKGVRYTLDAFARIANQLPNSALHFVGDGPGRPALEQRAAELGLQPRVFFHGFLTPEQTLAHMQAADVFLQHSVTTADNWSEGFGVSIAEAAACGLPVVATRCGGIPDQILDGATGFLVPQRDSDAMADRMLRLAADPELRRRLGRAARQRMLDEFDTPRQVQRLEDVLLAALADQKTPPSASPATSLPIAPASSQEPLCAASPE